MAWIIESRNPFEPLTIEKHVVPDGGTIYDWVVVNFPLTKEFPTPTVCLYNGKPVLRKDWPTIVLKERDVVNFIAVQGWEFVVAIIIAIVISLAVTLLMPVPDGPGDRAESDPVFSVRGQANSMRLGEPIENSYGRNRVYPSYASRPYYEYENNDQFQHSIFCIGHGEYTIHEIQIGDSSIDNFAEVNYEIVTPGNQVTIFPTNVFTSPEAGGQELYGPNETEYVSPGWVGPFPANPPGTKSTLLQVDLVYPKGLYYMSKKGGVYSASVVTEAQRRLIDDDGDPLGSWEPFNDDANFTETAATTTPQRRTYSGEVPEGRYEVRIRRTNQAALSSRIGDDVIWEGLRGWIDIEHAYGNVTLLAVKIRATNNLNDRTAERFNVICTRKLPIHISGSAFTAPVETRSIVWAFVDVFRGVYGGRVDDANFFDWDTLHELDVLYAARGDTFDWIFRDSSTVWDAARSIASAGRAVPLVAGSLITMRRDSAQSVPVTLFNQENIVEGSFDWKIKLWDLDEYDALRVEYTDASTGYKQETVLCLLPGSVGDHPEDLRMQGVQSRTQAYREGLYRLASNRYLRENVSFRTGLEGFIPIYGDLIAISHDVPSWGQGGYVVQAERGAGTEYHLWVSEPLVWAESGEHQIILRTKVAGVVGPFTAYQTTDLQQVSFETAQDIDFLLTGKTEPMLFLFGIVGNVTKYMKVVRVEPQGNEEIQISAVNESALVHSFDTLTPPPLGENLYAPTVPDLPEIDDLFITQVDDSLLVVQVAWLAALGAISYVIQSSEDGVNWTERARTDRTSVQLQVRLGVLYVRVAAIGNGQGPWIEESITIGPLAALYIAIPWDGLEWQISWGEVLNMVGWEVKVSDNTGIPVLKRTETLAAIDDRSYNYDYTKAITDGNIVREMLVSVDVLFEEEEGSGTEPSGTPATLALSNAIPTPATALSATLDSVGLGEVDYLLEWTVPNLDDLIRIKVWLLPTSGFDPSVETPEYDFTAGSPGAINIPEDWIVTIPLDSNDEHPAYYWRVGLFDVWGNEISTNITAEQTIPAYP